MPDGCLECFEVRVTLYLDECGDPCVAYDVSTPEEVEPAVSVHEVVGVLEFGKQAMTADWFAELSEG